MITVTTNNIPGKAIQEVKGLVQGSIVKTKHVGRDIGAGLKTLVGGEIAGYSDLMTEARDTARQRMEEEAQKLGANAVIGMRYQTSQVMNSASEVIAYGTAVVVE
ncbi:MAG TPA: YbjQ family protein [Bacillota bacterium]|nr:YbjQ family protein [Bacillota bacterium]